MFRRSLYTLVLSLSLVSLSPAAADAQVFFGGYHPGYYPGYAGFYDPFFWSAWGPYGYGFQDWRPQIRVKVEPEEIGDDAAVYVDGHYAGVVDDFDGWGVAVEQGPHTVTVFHEGYRTARFRVHVGEGQTIKLRHTLQALSAGERSEPPDADRAARESAASSYPGRRQRPDGR
jgi:hypothetical protein